MKPRREEAFRRNEELEALLAELNTALAGAEAPLVAGLAEPRLPIVLVVGAPRSGTTVLMQWLAGSGRFGYPSNLLSRFFGAPYLGVRIQQLLTDPRFRHGEELHDLAGAAAEFTSDVGKTRGALQPNEFWYFWRRFIPNDQPEWIDAAAEARIDADGLRAGFAALERGFGLPFATKGMILQYNLAALARILPTVVFLHTRRSPLHNVRSLLQARRRYYGGIETWFSVKPREYPSLAEADPYVQVAGQVHYTNRSIERELAALPARHGLTIDHEEFCASPRGVYDALRAKLGEHGYDLPADAVGPEAFRVRDELPPDDEVERIADAWRRLTGDDITP